MMSTKGRLATILIALAFFGCKGPLQTSAASMGDGGNGGPSAEGASMASSSGGTHVENIPDTTMNNETAVSVTIPANWKLQGILLQGGVPTCESYAFDVWRATSPDGQSRVQQMPEMLWAWGTGPKPANGCLPINGPISAQEFLQHIAVMEHADYVGPEPLVEENAKAQKELQDLDANYAAFYTAHNLPFPKTTVEVAAATVRYKNGTVAMKGRLKVELRCTATTRLGMKSMLRGMADTPATTVNKCTADVKYFTAPESQLAGLVRQWDAPGMGAQTNKEWSSAWGKRYADESNARNQAMIKGSWDAFNARQREIAHTMAVHQEEGNEFRQNLEQQGADAREQTREGMVARSTAASDVVDYALNQQTVMNTNTGQVYKLPNQVTVGGALQQVHGNGTP